MDRKCHLGSHLFANVYRETGHAEWAETELKKAYAALQDEIYRLKDRIKQQEGATLRTQEMLGVLERSQLQSPDVRGTLDATSALCRRLQDEAEARACMAELIDRIELHDDGIKIALKIQVPCSQAGVRTSSVLVPILPRKICAYRSRSGESVSYLAAWLFSVICDRSPKKRGPDHRLPVISRATSDSER